MDTTKELSMAKRTSASKKQRHPKSTKEMLDEYINSDQGKEIKQAMEAMGLTSNAHAGNLNDLLNLLYPGSYYKKA